MPWYNGSCEAANYSQEKRTARKDDYDPNNKNHQNQVLRQAVRQALLELGLLTITRRSIPLPPKRKERAKIS